MKNHADADTQTSRRAAAAADRVSAGGATAQAPCSPREAAQRQRIQTAFGIPVQKVGVEEEPLQGQFDVAQRVEDEEPMQGRFEAGGLPAALAAGVAVNDDPGLEAEAEADVVGANALTARTAVQRFESIRVRDQGSLLAQPTNTERQGPVQRFAACYTNTDMGYEDPHAADGYWHQTIGFVRYARVGGIVYTLGDGTNTGSIKHYVPSNWISKNLIDDHIQGKRRGEVHTRLTAILNGLGLAVPGYPVELKVGFDAFVSDAIDSISDYEQNLFRDVPSSGDGGGTTLDVPTDAGVLGRVEQARNALLRFGIAHPPL